MTDDWARRRLAELHAAAPVKRKKSEPFVRLTLSWAVRAATATNCPKATVWIWLVYRAWQVKSTTVAVPSGPLARLGVPRETKRRALKELEAGGLITISQQNRKTPLVTLL
jgi:hypothetical protein